jgi:hypothetical protein
MRCGVTQLVCDQLPALLRHRIEAALCKDDLPTHRVGIRRHRIGGRFGALACVDAHIGKVVPQACLHVLSHIGRYRLTLTTQHLVHNVRRNQGPGAGRVAV